MRVSFVQGLLLWSVQAFTDSKSKAKDFDSEDETKQNFLQKRGLQSVTNYASASASYSQTGFGLVLRPIQTYQYQYSPYLQNLSYYGFYSQNPWRTYDIQYANTIDYTNYINQLNLLYRNQQALLNQQYAYQQYIVQRNNAIYSLYNQQYQRQQVINSQLAQQRVLANQLRAQEGALYQQQNTLNNLLYTRQQQIYAANYLQAGIVRAQQIRAYYNHLLYHRHQQELYLQRVNNAYAVQLQQYQIYLRNLNYQNAQLANANNAYAVRINSWIGSINTLRSNVLAAQAIANQRLVTQQNLRAELSRRQQLAIALEREAQRALVTRNNIVAYYTTLNAQNYQIAGRVNFIGNNSQQLALRVSGIRRANASALQQLYAVWLNAQHAQYANWMRWYTSTPTPTNAVGNWNSYLNYAIYGRFPQNYVLPWASVVDLSSQNRNKPFYVQYPNTNTIFYPGNTQGYSFGENYVYPGAGKKFEGVGGISVNFARQIQSYFAATAREAGGIVSEYQQSIGVCNNGNGVLEYCYVPRQQVLVSQLDNAHCRIGLDLARFETQYQPCVGCN